MPETRQGADTMSLRSLEYAVSESAIGIRRNGLMSVASIVTIALSFSILGAFALLALGLNDVAQSLLNDFEIGVFLRNDVTEEQVSAIEAELKQMPHVAKVSFITKDAAWAKMRRDLQREVDLSGVQGNPLPDSFCIKLDHPRHTAETARELREIAHVEEVVEGRQIVLKIVKFADMMKLIGIIAAGGLFLIAAFIVSNTIRLTLYARRREIRIMQLVGASNWFIRMPFMLEGMLLGSVGGAIAFGVVLGGSQYVSDAVSKAMPWLGQFSSRIEPTQFLAGMVALGCVVGAVGSTISIRKFLKAGTA